jgi:hypothetical protein
MMLLFGGSCGCELNPHSLTAYQNDSKRRKEPNQPCPLLRDLIGFVSDVLLQMA